MNINDYIGKNIIAKNANNVNIGTVVIDKRLGGGGEGDVYKIKTMPTINSLGLTLNNTNTVAKLYFEPESRKDKVTAMLKTQPHNIAWPVATLYYNNEFIGFLMPEVDFDQFTTWGNFSNKSERMKIAPDFGFDYAFITAINFANILKGVHDLGHVIGDLNESNQLVGGDASVFIVDADSAQIKDGNKVYPSLVGKPEYTAPELIGGSLKDKIRTPQTDIFAFSVLVWQLLSGGVHPVQGISPKVNNSPISDNATISEKIKAGFYPALGGKPYGFKIPVASPTSAIPSRITKIIKKGLSVDPNERPSLDDFIIVFEDVGKNMTTCYVNNSHHWDKRDSVGCLWCAREQKGLPNPWNTAQTTSNGSEKLKAHGQKILPTKKLQTKPSSSSKTSVKNVSISKPSVVSKPTSSYQRPTPKPNYPSGYNAQSSYGAPANQTYSTPPVKPVITPSIKPVISTTRKPTGSKPTLPPNFKNLNKKGISKVEVIDNNDNVISAGIYKLGSISPLLMFFGWLKSQPERFAVWWNEKEAPNIFGLIIGIFWIIAINLAWSVFPLFMKVIQTDIPKEFPNFKGIFLINNWLLNGIIGSTIIISILASIFFIISAFYVRKLKNGESGSFNTSVSRSIQASIVAPFQWGIFLFNFFIMSIVRMFKKPTLKNVYWFIGTITVSAILLITGNFIYNGNFFYSLPVFNPL